MWTRLTFCSLQGRRRIVIVGFIPCPYLDTLSQMLLCDLSCQSLFLGWPLTLFCLEGLISPPFSLSYLTILSLKTICVVQCELRLLSSALPLHKTSICPLNVFQLSYCPFRYTKNKQTNKTITGIFLTLSLPSLTHSYHTTPASPFYTHRTHQSCLNLS